MDQAATEGHFEASPENLADVSLRGLKFYQQLTSLCQTQLASCQPGDIHDQLGAILGQALFARMVLEGMEKRKQDPTHAAAAQLMDHLIYASEEALKKSRIARTGEA